MKKAIHYLCPLLSAAFLLASCSEDGPGSQTTEEPGLGTEGTATDNGTLPPFSQTIPVWHGEKATDADDDAVGTNDEIYHELSSFNQKVTVEFAGKTATVTTANQRIRTYTEEGYATVDFQTGNVSGVEIIVKGQTSDGGLKIYGGNKFKLTLDGANIRSNRGPAINNQCKKRVFVHLADGSVNSLSDCTEYTDDPYYRTGSTPETEDRKGCFFAEGDMIVSGTGVLTVQGLYRHGIAVDGYMVTRPGTTIAVTEAAKNCIHLKGDAVDDIGLWVKGGYIYALTASPAGKAVKTDQNIRIDGGKLVLNTTGDGTFDPEVTDTSSAACLKADTYVTISDGDIELRSTGKGGKGINASTTIDLTGGTVGVSCSGEKYIYSEAFTASSKAVKAVGPISLTGGSLTVLSTGRSDGSRGIETDADIDIAGCEATVYAYDDALNAPRITIAANSAVSAYSVADDGIRAKESIAISGGSVTAVGGTSPAGGIYCNTSAGFTITGGTVIAMGGSLRNVPSSATENYRTWTRLTAAKDTDLTVSDGDTPILNLTMPRTFDGGAILIASPLFPAEGILTLTAEGNPVATPEE
ncbi:MAG: carbohydrate-binding domain-containing protein [Bacteroidales bacterium]|nr:carbohydrate-binding domain-containing protein [Bacteroidales bacterium]